MRQLTTMEALKADEKLADIFDFYVGDLEVPEEGSMQDLLGGDMYIAEDADDLATIAEMSGMLAYTMAHLDAWEVYEPFYDYALLCEITNNAGGDVFIIPLSLLED